MKNQPSLPHWGSVCALAFVALMYFGFWTIATDAQASQNSGSIDKISISSVQSGETQKIDTAVFPHEKHAEAISASGKDCMACHKESDNGTMSFAFRDADKYSGDELKNYYHENCVACHSQVPAEKKAPQLASCRSCHSGPVADPAPNFHVDFSYGEYLHDLHEESPGVMSRTDDEDNCSACHHSLNENMKPIALVSGEEAACSSCHQYEANRDKFIAENPDYAHVPSFKTVSHKSCVTCHVNMGLEPVSCSGCHTGNDFNIVAPEQAASLPSSKTQAASLDSSASTSN